MADGSRFGFRPWKAEPTDFLPAVALKAVEGLGQLLQIINPLAESPAAGMASCMEDVWLRVHRCHQFGPVCQILLHILQRWGNLKPKEAVDVATAARLPLGLIPMVLDWKDLLQNAVEERPEPHHQPICHKKRILLDERGRQPAMLFLGTGEILLHGVREVLV